MSEQVREALSFIDPYDRDTWLKMAMAVKSELGDVGFEIWDAWSAQADNYNSRSAQSVWKSVDPMGTSGTVTIGSLYYLARSNGWTPSKRLPATQTSKRQLGLPERNDADKRCQERSAAEKAATMLQEAHFCPHDYLSRKGFPTEKGFVLVENLLVPVRDVTSNALTTLQQITPKGDKYFLKHGKVSGCAYVLGSGPETYYCEGYATALSIRLAMISLYREARVAVCFSAGNLPKVTQRLGKGMVIADNDQSGAGERYAKATGLPWWLPPDVGDDANDFHQQHGIAALANELRNARRQL